MYLTQSIPLLFGIPDRLSSSRAIFISMMILGVAFGSFLIVEIWEAFPFFLVMTALLSVHGYICLRTTSANLLFIVRYFLVWILIFGTAVVWFLFSGDVLVAPFGVAFQTLENTRLLVMAGIFSLCGSLVGWHTSLLRFKFEQSPIFFLSDKKRESLQKAGVCLAVLFALLYLWKAGGIIGGSKVYSDGQEGFALTFGIFNICHFFGISLILLSSYRGPQIEVRYLLFALVTLILGMLSGSRADFLPQSIMLIVLLFNVQISTALFKGQYINITLWIGLSLLLLLIGYIAATFIGLWRSGLSPALALDIVMSSNINVLINEVYGHKMLFFETGNMMLGGLYSAIVQVRTGITGPLLGESYINYFIISPPAFLNLPRPLGLEWATDIGDVIMTQGGIFEVAEAFWNFDLVGCFVVSFFISYLFGWLLQRGLRYSNYFYLIWYLIFGLHSFRSIWYQNFSYFRLATVMLVVYLVSKVLCAWFVADRHSSLQNS